MQDRHSPKNKDTQYSVEILDLTYLHEFFAHSPKIHINPKANALGLFIDAGVMVLGAAEL